MNPNAMRLLKDSEFIEKEIGLEIVGKEICHFKANIEKLKNILLMPGEQGARHLKNLYLPQKNTRIIRLLSTIKTGNFKSAINEEKIESLLLERFEIGPE